MVAWVREGGTAIVRRFRDTITAMTSEGSGDLVWLGRLGVGSLLGYVLVAGYLLLRPPALSKGTFCERAETPSEYDHNCVTIDIDKPDLDSDTVGHVFWSTSPPHTLVSHLSMRRHGKAEHGYRYDLFVPGEHEPVGSLDDDGNWVHLRFVSNPSKEYWLKTDQPTFSSWAE
jgi:hypothetical protein